MREEFQSLDVQQLSKDGRMRNPEEKLVISQEVAVETEVLVKPKEVPSLPLQQNVRNGINRKNQKEVEEKEEEEVFGLEKKTTKKIEVLMWRSRRR